jgi:magnesium and cobalt exporter, CNNM family
MNQTLADAFVVLLLILVSGVFVAAEMSLVSLRDSQIKQMAHHGRRGHAVARLNENPNRFLSAVQIGVTLTGFLSAAFGGATLEAAVSPLLVRWFGWSEQVASTVALIAITVLIAYVSIVVGELTAKRLALQRTEAYAMALAPVVDLVAKILRPVIWLLGASTNVLVRLFGGDPEAGREEVSDEEIRALVSGSTTLGAEERRIVDDVFAAGDRSLREVMLPRTEVDFISGDTPAHKAVRELLRSPHSRYPVTGESADDVLGFVHVRDLLDPEVSTRNTRIADLARPVLRMPDTVRVLHALSEMRRGRSHLAIVVDEYGGTAGIVTMEDLVEELVGDISDEYDVVQPERPGVRGNLSVDGLTTLEDFADLTGLSLAEGPYDTLAGFFMAQLGQLPAVGDSVVGDGHLVGAEEGEPVRLEIRVGELDGRRASRFVVHRVDGADFTPVPD